MSYDCRRIPSEFFLSISVIFWKNSRIVRIRTFMTEGFIGFTTTLKNTEIISLEFDTQTFNLRARMQSCSIRLQDSLITNIFESNQYQYLAEKFSKENKPLRPFLSVGLIRHVQPSSDLIKLTKGLFGSFQEYIQITYSSKWNIN